MAPEPLSRKLAAILYADVAGYSRLTGKDEEGTHAALTRQLDTLAAVIGRHGGRVVHYAGDALLAEFASVLAAVAAAIEAQRNLAWQNARLPKDRRVEFRVGINLGDVIVDRGDIYGDDVNVAARLESLAEPGGICVSQKVYEEVRNKLKTKFIGLGEQKVKNISEPVRVYRIEIEDGEPAHGDAGDAPEMRQDIRFCAAPDGVRIAYATVGRGPPLLKAANWLNHLEYDWHSPVWRHVLHELARDHKLIRYDERGNGLSDWGVDDISFEAFVRDLETVADAAGHERFALLGISQGCAVSVAYAARHPERLTHLVLYGGYARGFDRRGQTRNTGQGEAMITLIREGWGSENPAFRQIFTSLLVPDGTPKQMEWFNDLQRVTTSPENAARLRRAMHEIDVSDLLATVKVPTLVLHARSDAAVPFEEGRLLAAGIRGARFVALEGRNHLILEDEPAWALNSHGRASISGAIT
jgi:class 3 adenylate cyclase/pimeloyl-ACP methyl ester carboxylesterase